MSFETPERALTKREWEIIAGAAQEKASEYLYVSGRYANNSESVKKAELLARKANKIFDVLISLENEYYEMHPDEDPDKIELGDSPEEY